jgi:hypothetical protein
MKMNAGKIALILIFIFFGCLGCVTGTGGLFILFFGLMADDWQLMMDTGLEKSSLISTGAVVFLIGGALIAIPLILWLLTKVMKKKQSTG